MCDKDRGTTPRRAFTLIELIAVMVLLAILSGLAIVRYFDYSADAADAADTAAIQAINDAMRMAHYDRLAGGGGDRIDTIDEALATIQFDELPRGWSINGDIASDNRGNQYLLSVETNAASARFNWIAGPNPPNGAPTPIAAPELLLFLAPMLARHRRASA